MGKRNDLNLKDKKTNETKLNYLKTLLIGFGFLSTSIAWSVYNANTPLMLEGFITESKFIGAIMSIDNVFAVILLPIFGRLSDKTRSKHGRRKPYILLGIPISSLLFIFIPATRSLASLMLTVISFNLTMSVWRNPIISLMPDLTPERHRSKANGIINLMGGIGSILAFFGGSAILKATNNNFQMVFIFTAIIMMIAWVVLIPIKEPTIEEIEAISLSIKKEDTKIEKRFIDKQLIFLLVAIFFWFTAHNTLETFFTLYATNFYKVDAAAASLTLGIFSVAFVIFALPAGIIGEKIGRKKTIMIGITAGMIIYLAMFFLQSILPYNALQAGMILAGFAWACININSLPMVLEHAGVEKIGTFTGLYYTASQSAAVIAPIVFGFIDDFTTRDKQTMLLFSAIAYLIALVFMSLIKDSGLKKEEVSQ